MVTKKRPSPRPKRSSAQDTPPQSPAQPEPAGDSPQKVFPIVGIGASAGGLEAFRQLLQNLPADTGAAFVLVQHLSPTHESILAGLLARSTAMPVGEALDVEKIEPDHVYVIPSHMDLAITDGHLKLLPRTTPPDRHMPIDLFFRTLAEVRGSQAIGVVLSGTASDGTLGLKAIKAAGGICLAQDPQSAAFDGMPRSAIAGGCVDAILPPDGLAREIARLASGSYLREPGEESTHEVLLDAEKSALETIFAVLRKATGKDLAGYKKPTLLRRIRRRMALHQIDGIADYAGYLEGHPDEVQELYQDLLINVTSFFRDPEIFAALRRDVFPRLLRDRAADAPVRVWVPGCSTGEEAYSIAICLLESLDDLAASPPIQIFGTDVRDGAVDKARAGIYLENIASDVSPERLARFFAKVDGTFQVSKTVRDLCVFARHDLIRDPPFSHLDFISCRNVLIYLEPGVQRRVMANFRYALNPTGFLVLGSSETIVASSDLFLPVDREHKVFAPIGTVARTRLGSGAGTYMGGAVFGARAGAVAGEAGERGEVQREADRILLSRYVPAGVLVDEKLEILQFRGDPHLYVEHGSGDASLSLPRMIQKGLLAGLRELIQEARATRAPVRRQGLTFRHGERFRSVDIEAVPVQARSAGKLCFLVLFAETPAAIVSPEPAQFSPNLPRRETDRQIDQLERELATTQQYLQAVIEDQGTANEELQGANEEILSSNEELQSLNEELETAKEELQSGNEELSTLNEELQNRNLELGQLGDDLVNLFSGLHIPVVLLSPELRLRRFTPAAARLMNLLPTDVNRPLSDIRPNFDLPSLEVVILAAIETVTQIEREVQDRQGCWYSLRIRPYKTRDNRIDGAVMVLVDIDALKRAAEQVAEARDFADAIIETVRDPLLVLDGELRVERANRNFYDIFRVRREETEGQFLYDLGNRQWSIPALREALRSILAGDRLNENRELQGFEVEHEFPEIGRRTMVLNARRVWRDGRGAEKILVAMEDRTEVKKVEKERALLVAREQRVARQAEVASRLKDEFLATVSHELRGPLSAMAGWVHVLATDKVDAATAARGLAAIQRNVQAQARLVEDLLDAARITTGKLRLTPLLIDLLPVVEEAVETLRVAADAKGIALELTHDDAVTTVLGDPDRLQQVAWNLISNAVKFTPRDGRVEVWLGRVENFVQLRVRDTGQGIGAEFLPSVFKRFRQEESTHSRSQTGLGLGLSIVRHLVELHGGKASAASAGEGQGATFTVALPVPAILMAEPQDGQPARFEPLDGGRRPLSGLRLLVVEDEETGREMLTKLLEQYGAEVVAAASATEALAALDRGVPDVLLSDIGMPGESGYDLLRRVRALPVERGGRVPALAFTAYSSNQDRLDSLDAGFQAHLAKPTDPARLVAMITALVQRAD
ncbi:MAG TPA: chemotaxis protein CheB [Thermoanaerobaculia bacterium]|jgi:two-component system CheB/CheR fusion protein|nr:chemotaxis protein CheB [Thermoanaerobaculia bacterium]